MNLPADRITVKNNDVEQEIFMSYGLLNRLTRQLANIDQLPMLAVDPVLQETVLLELFTIRDAKGKPTFTPDSLDELQVNLTDIERLLDFVGDHIANFFSQAAEKAQRRMVEVHERMSKLMPTKPGL